MPGYFAKMEAHGFEELLLFHDPASGLKAAVAIHNTNLGPALGGVRMWAYPTEEAAIEDVLRLARGMTYKAAAADLFLGGGKSVILGDPCKDKSEALFRAFGRFVESLGGRYITAEDMGVNEADLDWVRRETSYAVGGFSHGTPSPFTAYGVLCGMKACAAQVYGDSSLKGLTVAVQGVGGVGGHLCRYLFEEGARLVVTDLLPERSKAVAERYKARVVAPEEIYAQECDIFAPCGGGGVVNPGTVEQFKCKIIAGGANNVLLNEAMGRALQQRGILYAPDYVINAGGLIYVDSIRRGVADHAIIKEAVCRIEERLRRVFRIAGERGLTPAEAADRMAEERFRGAAPTPKR